MNKKLNKQIKYLYFCVINIDGTKERKLAFRKGAVVSFHHVMPANCFLYVCVCVHYLRHVTTSG